MLREAREAPQVVARLLAANAPLCRELGARLRAAPPPFAVTCARGSSDNAATFVKYLLEIHSGLVTASVGPSVTSVYAARPRMRDALFLAVSQSGRSPDILHLAQAGRDDGALTVALVNDTTSPLAVDLRSRAAASCGTGEERRGDKILHRRACSRAAARRPLVAG